MSVSVRALLCTFAVLGFAVSGSAAESKSEFARTTIDLGVVVSDVAKAVTFYTDAIGFSEAPGFSVSAEFCADAGLTDHKKLDIRVLVLGEGQLVTQGTPQEALSEDVLRQVWGVDAHWIGDPGGRALVAEMRR